MSSHFDPLARLAVLTGCNLAPGQPLIVEAPIEAMPLVEAIEGAAKAAGAASTERVIDDPDQLRRRLLSGDAAPNAAQAEQMLDVAKKLTAGAARIRILAPRPDLLDGIDPALLVGAHRAWGEASERAAAVLSGVSPADTAIPFPTTAWAARVFPTLSPQEAVEHLSDALATALRLKSDNPVVAWATHFARLERRKAKLAALSLQVLHIQGPDTQITLALAEQHRFSGGRTKADTGRLFASQLPLEAVSTAIQPAGTEGRLRITRPILLAGQRISGLTIEVSGGVVCGLSAEEGHEVLDKLLSLAPEARAIQSVAFVDRSAPAAQLGLNFVNPLLDACATSIVSLGGSPDGNAEGAALNIDACFGGETLQVSGTDNEGRLHPLIRDGTFVR